MARTATLLRAMTSPRRGKRGTIVVGSPAIIFAVAILIAVVGVGIVTRRRCCRIVGLTSSNGTFCSYRGLLLIIGSFGLLEDIDYVLSLKQHVKLVVLQARYVMS
jgi:hypothetical protein